MEQLFECKIDETKQNPDTLGDSFAKDAGSLARAVIDLREIATTGFYQHIVKQDIYKALSFLAYACEHPARRKRTSMNVEQMVETWLPLVKKLAIAHNVDDRDAASSALDEQLLPVLAAPVAEIRQFYRTLTQRLKDDTTVPWAVWKLFDFWGTNVLDKINKDEIIGLKKEIAGRIAEHSMEVIPREDWINSMIGALQWRSPEKLEQIEKKLEAGHKPKIKGRESCLFLVVDDCEVML